MTDISKEMKVLIEITSARGILIGDIKSSDPYVVVTMGKEKVHKTKYLSKTLNPEWGPEHNSTFMLQCPIFKLVDGDGLVFTVMDYDALSSDEGLGTVRLSVEDILTDGKQSKVHTRKITPPKDRKAKGEEEAGYLTICVRNASTEDEVSLINGEKKRFFRESILVKASEGEGSALIDEANAVNLM